MGHHKVNNKATLNGHTRAISQLRELSDGNIASSAWDGTVRIWQVDKTCKWTEMHLFEGRTVAELKSFPYGLLATSYSSDNKIWRYDMNISEAQPKPVRSGSLQGLKEEPWDVMQLHDGRVLTCSGNSDMALWNFNKAEIVAWLKGHERGPVTSITELSNKMLVSTGWDGNVIVWAKPDL